MKGRQAPVLKVPNRHRHEPQPMVRKSGDGEDPPAPMEGSCFKRQTLLESRVHSLQLPHSKSSTGLRNLSQEKWKPLRASSTMFIFRPLSSSQLINYFPLYWDFISYHTGKNFTNWRQGIYFAKMRNIIFLNASLEGTSLWPP